MAEKAQRTIFAITANNLVDGRVQYLGADRTWVGTLEGAYLVDDPAERDQLLAWGKSQSGQVAGCYVVEIGVSETGERTMSARERLRAAGESDVLRRIGYQA